MKIAMADRLMQLLVARKTVQVRTSADVFLFNKS